MTISIHHRLASGISVLACILSAPALADDRSEKVRPAQVVAFVAQPPAPLACPIVPAAIIAAETKRTKEIVPIIAGVLAALAGKVVTAGLNAGGDALEKVSKEKGFVSEGATSYKMARLFKADEKVVQARVENEAACLVLFVPGQGAPEGLLNEPGMSTLRQAAKASTLTSAFDFFQTSPDSGPPATDRLTRQWRGMGLKTLPALYAEVLVLPTPEGVVVRPVLFWYRERVAGAPSKTTGAEVHIQLATPGSGTGIGDIGTVFAGARLVLPKVEAGQLLDWESLKPATSLVLAPRPTSGYVDTRLAWANGIYTAAATKQAEYTAAKRANDSALRKDKAKSTPDTKEAVTVTGQGLDDAKTALALAQETRKLVQDEAIGATNVKLRVVIVRDANQFGLEVAKLLKGSADDVGKAVTTALTPASPWAATDTSYATALADLNAKQRDYDAAIAANDSGKMAAAQDALLVSKAKLNEAAAASDRPLPYPTLLELLPATPPSTGQ